MPKHHLTLSACLALLLSQAVAAQSPVHYRQFALGSSLTAVASLIEVDASTANTVHVRPVSMKELEWRPRFQSGAGSSADPVDVMLFRFYDDQLYMIVVDYDRRRTEGMASVDMVAAISATYGTSYLPSTPLGSHARTYGAQGSVLAVWGNSGHSMTLLQVAYPESYRLVIALPGIEDLARIADAEAVRLNATEAPQREVERQRKAADDAQVTRDKAKADNTATFKP